MHPDVAGMTFTGSYDVGFGQLYRRFAQRLPQAVHRRDGREDPAIVMASADLAQAVQGVHRSAFGMNGHKCSACSRVYVHRAVADQFLAGLVESRQRRRARRSAEEGCLRRARSRREQSYDDYQRYARSRAKPAAVVRAGGAIVKDGDVRARLLRPSHGADGAPARGPAGARGAVRPDRRGRRRWTASTRRSSAPTTPGSA